VCGCVGVWVCGCVGVWVFRIVLELELVVVLGRSEAGVRVFRGSRHLLQAMCRRPSERGKAALHGQLTGSTNSIGAAVRFELSMPPVVIENPILNSPFVEPRRHFRAWQARNKLANPQDARFSDAFLVVTPGITIRDRLRIRLASPQRHRDTESREESDLLNLLVEVSGEKKKDKAAKVATARNLWVPAVNNHGGFGRWAFVEVSDPWDAEGTIRAASARMSGLRPTGGGV
jgi:hypothetical protein